MNQTFKHAFFIAPLLLGLVLSAACASPADESAAATQARVVSGLYASTDEQSLFTKIIFREDRYIRTPRGCDEPTCEEGGTFSLNTDEGRLEFVADSGARSSWPIQIGGASQEGGDLRPRNSLVGDNTELTNRERATSFQLLSAGEYKLVDRQVTWRVLGVIYRNVSYNGKVSTMTNADFETARLGLVSLGAEVENMSNGALGLDVEYADPSETLSDWIPDGHNKGGMMVGQTTIDAFKKAYPKHDALMFLWKGGSVVPFSWGGLTHGAAVYKSGVSAVPIDRPEFVDRLVHELGHQIESYYRCGNLFDNCGGLGQSKCSGDTRYPNGSWSCCYRNIYQGNVTGQCLKPSTLSWHGRPMYPTYYRLGTRLGQ